MVIGSSSTRTSPNSSHVVVILSYFSTYFRLMQQVIRMTKGTGGMPQLKKRMIEPLVLFILPSKLFFSPLNQKLPNFTLISPISNFSVISTTLSFQTCEEPKQTIWNGLTGISNCSPESIHAKKIFSPKYVIQNGNLHGSRSGRLPVVFLAV